MWWSRINSKLHIPGITILGPPPYPAMEWGNTELIPTLRIVVFFHSFLLPLTIFHLYFLMDRSSFVKIKKCKTIKYGQLGRIYNLNVQPPDMEYMNSLESAFEYCGLKTKWVANRKEDAVRMIELSCHLTSGLLGPSIGDLICPDQCLI
jgi:hypothetical protein